MFRPLVSFACVLCIAPAAARAADVPVVPPHPQQLFSPTDPNGVASEDPRSPLADLIVNGDVRFASAALAQLRCPTDVVVFVRFGSKSYTAAAAPRGEGWPGAFMCQADASAEGDRPARP